MPTTYLLATDDTQALLDRVLEQYHSRLLDHDVRIGIIMAYAAVDEDTGEKQGRAIKGYAGAAAAAQVKAVPLKDRLVKKYDVELLIDGDNWPELSEREKIALLDHEMTHILETDAVDDLHRPKVKMRDEDFIAWGFWEVIQRHGTAALEHRALTALADKHGQLLLDLSDAPSESGLSGVDSVTISTPGMAPVTVTGEQFSRAAKRMARKAAGK